ncbi:MAG TPA: Gfo/Idh/MocA family oxidoreductase [Pyrinomonadaceae bacterium]|nr:Gfo/Idh/MocA family oxidoreductase [Pyrinomonadaceae bacterium]
MALKVIVVGLGARGREWARAVAADPGFELAAGVEPDEGARLRAAAETGLAAPRLFGELGEALEGAECDAVVVVTPADRHVAACEAAIERGRAVLVEKPFATRLADAARVVRLAEARGVPVVVGQNYRYMRAFRAVRRLVREGALGRVGQVVCHYWRVPHEMAPWLAGMEHSVLWGMGVHHLDALRHALGRRVTGVAAESFTAGGGGLPEGASLRALLDFEGGARATYTASYESSGHEFFERGQEFYLRLTGERATLHVFHRWLVLCERGRWPRPVRRGPRGVGEERELLGQLARAVLRGEEPDAGGRDNLQTMAVVEACLRSSAERRRVNPQELLAELEEPAAETVGAER